MAADASPWLAVVDTLAPRLGAWRFDDAASALSGKRGDLPLSTQGVLVAMYNGDDEVEKLTFAEACAASEMRVRFLSCAPTAGS